MSVDPAAEEQFGPYLVYERLGVGGMATVHRALEQNENGEPRTIALKRLLPHLAEDASFIKSFVREAKLASILNHVNIVQIHELGRVGTEYFISMEYIDGRDVRRLLRHARKVTGPPPIYVTVGLMIQLCDALDYAHNKCDEDGSPLRLIHRDISPSNLIVTSGGILKIIDFGIAKAESSQLRTQTGRVKGKLAYMAPEAISGSRDLDARSDLWACGVILHELCTARPLFASKNEYQTLLKVQRGDIMPPSTFNQACPPELDAIVFRALARDPNQRFASAGELREELLKLKRQYALQTGYKDVAGWIDWAFGLEAPGGFSGDTSGVAALTSRVHAKTPRPPRDSEEDEAVEVVWGSGNNESEDGPVVLEEVPDVSEKMRPKRDTEDDSIGQDDIPTPLPSHGTMPSIYGDPEIVVVPQTASQKIPRVPMPSQTQATADALARGTDPPVARGSAQMPKQPTGSAPNVRQTGGMPAVRQPSGANPIVKVPKPSDPVAPRNTPTQGQKVQRVTAQGMPAASPPSANPPTGPVRVDQPQFGDRMKAQRARDSVQPPNVSLDDRIAQLSEAVPTNPFGRAMSVEAATNPLAKPLSEEELFGHDAAEVLAGVSAQMDAMETRHAMRSAEHLVPSLGEEGVTAPEIKPISSMPSVPVVRFSKSITVPPVNDTSTSTLEPSRFPSTKPGLAPVQMPKAISNSLSASPSQAQAQLRQSSPSRPPANVPLMPAPPVAVVESKSKKTLLFVLVGLLLAGGTATIVALTLSGGDEPKTDQAQPTQPAPGVTAPVPAQPQITTGKVKFALEPADAEIKIEGKPVHKGSPWTTELPAGIHQIEIHREGYKSWLTSIELSANETASLRVMLEAITSAAVAEDATLTITTTPPELEVLLDGELQPQKTPFKATLKPGPHKIAVRQNGVEVWQQNLDAESASDYEFNPSFTDDKKRERAQRATPRPIQSTTPRPQPIPAPTSGDGSAAGSAAAGSTANPAAGSAAEPPKDSAPLSEAEQHQKLLQRQREALEKRKAEGSSGSAAP